MAKIEKNNPIIESRLKKLRKIVAQLESVPKEKRDMKLLAETRARIKNIESWSKDRPDVRITMTKDEFVDKFKKEMELPEAPGIVTIPDIETLDRVWDEIKFKSIQIEAPDFVKKEMVRRYKQLAATIKPKGFR